jgi:hypothetical protein
MVWLKEGYQLSNGKILPNIGGEIIDFPAFGLVTVCTCAGKITVPTDAINYEEDTNGR